MARHASFISQLQKLGEEEEEEEGEGAPERALQLSLQILIKVADTSNVLKPFMIGKKWLVRVTEEFFQQGDKERRHGLPGGSR
mmetsp:Transcript_43076/g.66188  ORF Transcript_43076/g.66188 Transcript_43076/m.66188 type:complete len:83 (+) Transcript_43076:914-1162(+)